GSDAGVIYVGTGCTVRHVLAPGVRQSMCELAAQLMFQSFAHLPDLHSFPTRRSSDLGALRGDRIADLQASLAATLTRRGLPRGRDRKSTRLNSSHGGISYAVFRLKQKRSVAKVRRCVGAMRLTCSACTSARLEHVRAP